VRPPAHATLSQETGVCYRAVLLASRISLEKARWEPKRAPVYGAFTMALF